MAENSKQLKHLTQARAEDVPPILDYLKAEVGHCLYMYIDIKKYGIQHEEMTVWQQCDQGGISLVVMKYYNSISFYSRADEWSVDDLVELILHYLPASISAPLQQMEQIASLLPPYSLSSGWVFEYHNFKDYPFQGISHAKKEDLREVSQLLCMDHGFGAIYDVDGLQRQLEERLETGMGRNLVIRGESNEIVAQIATFAECDGIAITSGMIVHPEHRRSSYGTILESNLVGELKGEQFRVFTFVIEKKRKRLLDALKQIPVGQYGRLTLKAKEREEEGGSSS